MKKVVSLLFICGLLLAQDYGYNNPSKVKSSYDDNYKYKSSSGTEYKYDLSKPDDSLKYSTDMNAQLKDSVNPNVGLDRGMGQYGGGSR